MKRYMYFLPLVAFATVATTSCVPHQLDIDITIRDRVVLKTLPDGSQTVTVTGIQMCTGGSDPDQGEHLDMFIRVQNWDEAGELTSGAWIGDHSGHNQHCNKAPTQYTTTWVMEPHESLEPGPAFVRVSACTNPGERIDEDCDGHQSNSGYVVAG
ncbi:MAG TPA: hypothetical protein VHK88_13380 [Aquihabitans sp.]|jgi:hypothetical protein|nr:hypothetical protein [Aquihabitans sp.]